MYASGEDSQRVQGQRESGQRNDAPSSGLNREQRGWETCRSTGCEYKQSMGWAKWVDRVFGLGRGGWREGGVHMHVPVCEKYEYMGGGRGDLGGGLRGARTKHAE